MKYFLAIPISVVAAAVVLVVVAAPALGGSIRGINKDKKNSVQDKTDNDLVISNEEVRRILDGEGGGPIVSENCTDTVGFIEVSAVGTMSNCRKIRKNRLCERQHNGKHLYESCEKSCGICIEPIPTTDAPTADLVDLVITDTPIEASAAPSLSPTIKFTDEPTEAPSHYPTTAPTENTLANIVGDFDDDTLLSALGEYN